MPAERRIEQRADAGLRRPPLMQYAHRHAENRRLGDAGRGHSILRAPDLGSGVVAVAWLVEHDLRDHAVRPLPLREPLQLPAAAVDVIGCEPHGDKGRIPVPLKRVEPIGRQGISAPVIAGEDGLGGGDVIGCHGNVRSG
ncbi:hypothetical protein CG51_19095 [Haematobacter missouriensis]|nr:hypothetical protein CG51_19095 [Haematobacter missouriensis]